MYSLRRTLAVRFSLTLLLALLLIGVWTFLGVHRTLRRQLDLTLGKTASLMFDVLSSGAPLAVHEGPSDTAAFVRDLNRIVVLRDGAGRVVAANTPLAVGLPADSAAFAHALAGDTTWTTEPWGSHWVRSRYVPVPPDLRSAGAILQVAASTELLARANRETLYVVAATILLSLVATVFGAAWLAGSAVVPVAEIAAQAEGIGPQMLGHRITVHGDVQELQKLVTVLNRMLERLDTAIGAQRRIIADVGHDLRTPLTSMRGHLEVALRGERDTVYYQRVLASVLEDVEHLSSIGESMVLLARIEAGELRPRKAPVNLTDLAAAAVRRSEARAGGRHFELDGVGAPVTVNADATMIGLVLDHLLDNVIRHTPPGTTVLTSVRANGSPEITVRDDGPGIPDEALAHLFGRLYRGDDARTRGTGTGLAGLGLTIAAAIVDAHGGRISAANVQPSGLQVVIAFPQQTLR